MPWSDYLAQKKRGKQFDALAPQALAALDQAGATLWGDNGPWFPKYQLSTDGLRWVLGGTWLGRFGADGRLASCRLVVDIAGGTAFRVTLNHTRSAFADIIVLCKDLSGSGFSEGLASLMERVPIGGTTGPTPQPVAVTRQYHGSVVGRSSRQRGGVVV